MHGQGTVSGARNGIRLTVAVAALGYFVDVFDLILFGMVRIPSTLALGVPQDLVMAQSTWVLTLQQAGLLAGGVLWGVWGDKQGRVKVLFGSILLYSLMSMASAFVTDVFTYAAIRFLAGLGLAAELGVAITLTAELLPRETRGKGTTIIAAFGLLGAVAAWAVTGLTDWRTGYIIGGVLGLLLLFARLGVRESGMFAALERSRVRRGDLILLLSSSGRLWRYLWCVMAGLPVCFSIGVLVYYAPEIGRQLGLRGAVSAATAIVTAYAGMSLGDLASGLLSQQLRSRRRVMLIFMLLSLAVWAAVLLSRGMTPFHYYLLCGLLGFGSGYWVVLLTASAEQFGTNLRSTAVTTIPNFIRGLNGPVASLFVLLLPLAGLTASLALLGAIALFLSLSAVKGMRETFGKDLGFIER